MQCASVSAEVGAKGADIEMCAQGLQADLAAKRERPQESGQGKGTVSKQQG